MLRQLPEEIVVLGTPNAGLCMDRHYCSVAACDPKFLSIVFCRFPLFNCVLRVRFHEKACILPVANRFEFDVAECGKVFRPAPKIPASVFSGFKAGGSPA